MEVNKKIEETIVNKIWLSQYPQNIPAEINTTAYRSLVEMFEGDCQKYADLPAFTNLGVTITYKELEQQSRYFAAYLQNTLRLQKGERVAIMMPNLLQYPIAMFGILRAGLIVVNVNPLYTATELAHQLKDSDSQTIVVLANFAHVLQEALPQTNIKNVIITEAGDLLGGLKGKIVNFVVKRVKKMVPAWHIANTIPFKEVLKKGKPELYHAVDLEGKDIAFLQYTGGTTGVAKGAILTHSNMVCNVLQTLTFVSHAVSEKKEFVIVALPLYHIFSLTICCLSFLHLGGHGLLITNPRDFHNFIKELKKVPFTVFVGVNTLFNALLHQPEFSKLNFCHLRLSVSGGMPLQKVIAERWNQMTGNYILEGYGLTESSPVVTVNPTNITRFTGSIGIPLPSTDIKVCNEEGEELPLGEIGELYVKGPQVMEGYWQKPEETVKVIDKEGWLRTGDIVKVDEQGFVYIVDRKKDMVIVSGFNVYPTEIEEVIASHPKVLEVGVIGVPDERSGEKVKAFIVKKDESLTEEEIISFCQEKLTRYKIPKVVEFRKDLPKTNVGKILRRKLRDL